MSHALFASLIICFTSLRSSRAFLGVLSERLDSGMTAYYPQKFFLVLDNVRFPKEPSIISLGQEYPRKIAFWFLPPYSPQLNAKEPI